ncbi:serine protease [Kribbella albertanoniae]|uniref:Serine protease n=1 Tax=Kribbella albertanoniae TaxID=1266829 RepID=A0A4R4PH19_9ACTN|nr:serine protease [Kribbella albertanoniae]
MRPGFARPSWQNHRHRFAQGDEEDDSVVHDGRQAPPRPPRRVPAGAPPLTQLQPPVRRTPPPARRPWLFGRFLVGLVVLLLVVAGGVAAGWFIREDRLSIDPAKTRAAHSASVVRVLATTCSGTGEGTGTIVGNGLVLTAGVVVQEPRGVAVVTSDGAVRRANVLRSGNGVALLQVIGRMSQPVLPLATGTPDPQAERALFGYTQSGELVVQQVGSARHPRALGEVMNSAKLGGPVVAKSGQLVGMVTGTSAADSRIATVADLRPFVAGVGGVAEEGGDCAESRGPQGAVNPKLQVAATALATQAQKLLANYLVLQNRHDFVGVRKFYSPRLVSTLSTEQDRLSHQTTYFFDPTITEVTQNADTSVNVRVSMVVLFASTAHQANGQTCNRLDTRYTLVRSGTTLLLDRSKQQTSPTPCDGT